jgi:hypothetical protein
MPGYSFRLVEDMVDVEPKEFDSPALLPLPAVRLKEETYALGRDAAPGWDIYGLEANGGNGCPRRTSRP